MENNNQKSEYAKREEKILEFWRENKIFKKSLEKNKGKEAFVFFEGPPTANGKPGIHHLEARAFKDAIPRYKTMRGYYVRRKGGWDTHGLPVELQVEKALGLDSKKGIENFGVAEFNDECKKSVWEYLEFWNKFTERIGYWVDQENPYVTYHNSYIESLWNIVSEVNAKNLLYKDYKVVPWCPRCGTALSSHELAQGYQDVKDLSVTVKFRLVDNPNTYILAWTTTPWTLPGNVALAVGEELDYVKVKSGDEFLICAKERLVIMENPEVIEEFKGSALVGLKYEPLYPFLSELAFGTEKDKLEKAYQVYGAKFVTTTDGTGVVHTAVMYGQDDFELGTEIGLPKMHLLGLDGKFFKNTDFLAERFVKDEEVAIDIIKDLAKRGLLFSKEKYEHSYPHCWRCKTPLIYYARDSWYIRMSDPKIKKALIKENEYINWEPSHIREGRFGEWLKDIKDWAISRERYWGTPLPIWVADDGEKIIVDSIETIKKHTRKSGNKYFIFRHGEALSNRDGFLNSEVNEKNSVTPEGEKQIKKSIHNYRNQEIDLVFASPLLRTKQTAEIIAQEINFPKEKIIFDDRLKEIGMGDLEGKGVESYREYFEGVQDKFTVPLPGGESHLDVTKRVGEFLYEIDNRHEGKNILIVSHGDPLMAMLLVSKGYQFEKAPLEEESISYMQTGEMRELDFVPLPHNKNYALDLHRPYVDEIVLIKKDKLIADGEGMADKEFYRVPEVLDVWFDSGAMPFAQDHYPFENKDWLDKKGFPADYISEAIDQTRGWFYTLHAVGVLVGRGKAYKNVICLGHLLDKEGKKMSKSLGNIVDPWSMMDKYGVDTLRLWMYSVNQPGESKNFDEKTVVELNRQVFGLLYNILSFYELYRDKNIENNKVRTRDVLDEWIVERFNQLVKLMTEHLDSYRLLEPTRALRDFIGDFSTWYLRRSREKIKNGDKEAKQVMYFVLVNLIKLMAPFAPFASEDIWQTLRHEDDAQSIHLLDWPTVPKKIDENVLNKMKKVRKIVSLGLEARQREGIRVRQPLSKIEVKDLDLKDAYIALIKDELNVKNVLENPELESEVLLDVLITPELKEEGIYREFVRAVQDLRKQKGLLPTEQVAISVHANEEGIKILTKFEAELIQATSASKLEFAKNTGEILNIEEYDFRVTIN